jgi:hypothetical protein
MCISAYFPFSWHLIYGFWIGANDKDIEDDWVWESNKSKLLFSDWLVGEPDNAKNNEDNVFYAIMYVYISIFSFFLASNILQEYINLHILQ